MRIAVLAAALVAGLPLVACGEDDAGNVVEGTGYELTVPEGWEDESEAGKDFEVSGFRPDVVLIGDREDGFSTNVNVIRTQGAGVGLDAQVRGERALLEEGRIPGSETEPTPARGLTPVERTSLSGEPARAYEFERSHGERTLKLRQLIAIHDGTVYVITLTTLPDEFDQERETVASVVDSWRWR